jgi:prepilin-type N-terminal cleavage/methylation domain-containing protein
MRRQEQRGFAILEMLMALALLGVIGAGFMSAVSTASVSTARLDEHVQAVALARSQLEQIKGVLYASSYSVTVSPPLPYSVTIQVLAIDDVNCIAELSCNTLQQITVQVSRPGKTILSLANYRKK